MSPEERFLVELGILKNEVFFALSSLYTELAIHGIANKDKRVSGALNYSPTFWNTIFSALQHSTFITLGRIFDFSSEHNIHILFKIVEENKNIFSRESFKSRWPSGNCPQEYLDSIFVPTSDDFRKFKKFIARQRKIYEEFFRPIRHQFGHKKLYDKKEIESLFSKVQIRELEKFCLKLKGIYDALWQLYYNGRGPLLPIKCGRYSTKNILKNRHRRNNSEPPNIQFVDEAKVALNLLKLGKIANDRKIRKRIKLQLKKYN